MNHEQTVVIPAEGDLVTRALGVALLLCAAFSAVTLIVLGVFSNADVFRIRGTAESLLFVAVAMCALAGGWVVYRAGSPVVKRRVAIAGWGLLAVASACFAMLTSWGAITTDWSDTSAGDGSFVVLLLGFFVLCTCFSSTFLWRRIRAGRPPDTHGEAG